MGEKQFNLFKQLRLLSFSSFSNTLDHLKGRCACCSTSSTHSLLGYVFITYLDKMMIDR